MTKVRELLCVTLLLMLNFGVLALLLETRSAGSWVNATGVKVFSIISHTDDIARTLGDERSGVARTLRNINILTAQIDRTSNVTRLAAEEQRAYLGQASRQTIASLESLKTLVEHTDHNLNEVAIVKVAGDFDQLRSSMEVLTQDSHQLLFQSMEAMGAAARTLNNPDITATLRNVNSATLHLNGTAANMDQTTGYVRDMFSPKKASFWKQTVAQYLPAALFHFLPQRVSIVNSIPDKDQRKAP